MSVVEKKLTEYDRVLTQTDERSDAAEALAQMVAQRAIERLTGSPVDRSVLVLCCKDGKICSWLARHGALVTGVDTSPKVIGKAKEREAVDRLGITYVQSEPDDLYTIDDSSFDDVICHMALDKYDSLSSIIAEISRTIKLGGRFIFSVGHPCFEHALMAASQGVCENSHEYFTEDTRRGFNGTIRHRTLATYINAVAARGFTVRRVIEAAAEERDVRDRPDFVAWKNYPVALAIEAIFPYL